MTKKHFIALADHIKLHNLGSAPFSHRFTKDQLNMLAAFCEAENPNFNRERWLAYIAGECGPNDGRK